MPVGELDQLLGQPRCLLEAANRPCRARGERQVVDRAAGRTAREQLATGCQGGLDGGVSAVESGAREREYPVGPDALREVLRGVRQVAHQLEDVGLKCQTLDRVSGTDSLAEPRHPRDRGGGIVPELEVAGDGARIAVELLFLRTRQDRRDPLVKRRAPLLELRVVRDRLGQRVLEAVLGLRVGRALVDELRGAQASQPLARIACVELEQLAHDRLAEAAADHGGGLQQVLLRVGEPIDARREHGLDGRGHADLGNLIGEEIRAALSDEVPLLGEAPDHLLDEERVARRSLADARCEGVHALAAPEQRREQLTNLGLAERTQRDLLVVRVGHPARAVLGPIIQEQQGARPVQRVHEVLDERLGRSIDPMKILEQDDHGLELATRGDHAPRDAEEQLLTLLGLESRCGPMRIGHAEKLEEQRQRFGEARVELQQRPSELVARDPRAVALVDLERVAQQLDHRQERQRFAVRHTVRLRHADPLRAGGLEELEAQPALARTRIRDDADHAARTAGHVLERAIELGALVDPTDEAREPARA